MARDQRVKATVLLVGMALASCATPPVRLATTTVVLMPDEDGKVGAVTVSADGATQRIDTAYAAASVVGVGRKPSDVRVVGQQSVTASYARLLQVQPPKPKSFIVNFILDGTVLTAESKAMIPAVLQAVRERKPTEITIFGHTDAIGSEKRNVQLSAERARLIADLLRSRDPSLDRIDVQFFGDTVPLIPSQAGKPEPRNRRVEIMVL